VLYIEVSHGNKIDIVHQSHTVTDSDDSADELDAAKIASKKKSAPQWIEQIEKDNACKEHIGQFCLKFATHHHHLSKEEIGTWAILMVNKIYSLVSMEYSMLYYKTHHYSSTTVPPKSLKIGDKKPEPKAPKNPATDLTSQQTINPFATPAAMAYPYGFNPPPYMYPPHPGMPPIMPGYSPPYPSGSHHYDSPRYRQSYHRDDHLPSSDPPEQIEDVSQFPLITDWLHSLDNGSRGADGHNFSQFISFFERHKYIRICDIADNLSASALSSKCEGIADGTAQNIVSYAKVDTKNIRRREAKRGKARHY
jgi:hypothetical protein